MGGTRLGGTRMGRTGKGRGLDRRAVLAAAAGAALLHLAGCGKESGEQRAQEPAGKKGAPGKTGKPQRPNRPIAERPPGAKTTKRKHAAPQTSARHAKGPLPSELEAYLVRKGKDGTLVRGRRSRVLHHPVVCKAHLKPGAPPAEAPPPAGEPKVHQRYADAILYALIRAEADRDVALGVALVAAVTWPVSIRFADFARASIAASGRPLEEATLVAGFKAAGSPAPQERARQALRVLEERGTASGSR